MRITNIFAAILVALSSLTPAQAGQTPTAVTFSGVERSDSCLTVTVRFDFSGLRLKSNREISYIPAIVAGDNLCTLPRVVVAGRNRYIQNQRKHAIGPGEILTRPGSAVEYVYRLPYEQWMEQSQLILQEDECGCGFTRLAEHTYALVDIDEVDRVFAPQWAYVVPSVQTRKTRESKGSAYIDFRINRTEIDPNYRRNPNELANINDTIDMVISDPDAHIDAIIITGYASPDGSYANNDRLAKGRTASLAEYLRSRYDFPASIFTTNSIAENWAGLIDYLSSSPLGDADKMLAIAADTTIAPDVREARLRRQFPQQYSYMLENVLPALRRCDYEVEYTISAFTDPAKIAQVLKVNPGKLSLHELFTLAQTLDPASDDFREVFEVAVRLFPDDPTANLNAAFTAMRFDDLEKASRYLDKAGDSPNAIYARGVYAAKRGDYTRAVTLFEQARTLGLEQQAADAIAQLRAMRVVR